MRYGVLADVHGNLHALQAAVDELRDHQVDAFLCAGDLVGYGPLPNECVELIRELGAVCVAGNHDLIALGRLSADRCIPLARESLAWTRSVLSPDARAFLAALPLRGEAAGGVMLAHGSLDDPQEYIRRPEQAAEQLARLGREHPSARVLVVGHTHLARAWAPGGDVLAASEPSGIPLDAHERYLLNPGAVGQSREPRARARCMVLDVGRARASFLSVAYDLRGCRRALRRHGLPVESNHLSPTLLGRVRRRARRTVRHARRTGGAAKR